LRLKIFAIFLALLLAACQSGPPSPSARALAFAAASTENDPRYAGIVVDAGSGEILYAENATLRRHPASLTKMMTLYLLFEAMQAGRLSEDSQLEVSAAAARQPASKMGVRAGSTISVRDAILSIVVRSANDVALVVAENVAGSQAAFVAQMNQKAAALGLSSTRFRNPTGLPDPQQVTTAEDMAVLARALQTHFPGRYRVFSTREFSFDGRKYKSTNELLGKVAGMDGMKTGYIRASGYNLAASVKRGGRRIIVVVIGGPTGAARNAQVTALVDEYLPGGLFAAR
jgi:D-alanyl-D-alanine carboxypeptidase